MSVRQAYLNQNGYGKYRTNLDLCYEKMGPEKPSCCASSTLKYKPPGTDIT